MKVNLADPLCGGLLDPHKTRPEAVDLWSPPKQESLSPPKTESMDERKRPKKGTPPPTPPPQPTPTHPNPTPTPPTHPNQWNCPGAPPPPRFPAPQPHPNLRTDEPTSRLREGRRLLAAVPDRDAWPERCQRFSKRTPTTPHVCGLYIYIYIFIYWPSKPPGFETGSQTLWEAGESHIPWPHNRPGFWQMPPLTHGFQ